MTQRTARIVSALILVAVIAAFGTLITLDVIGGDRLTHPPIVVVGDPDTPGLARSAPTSRGRSVGAGRSARRRQ